MKFKITEITTLKLKVEYEDGSWAYVPTQKDADKEYYAQRIVDFCQTPQEPVPIADIPYSIGHEGEVGDDVLGKAELLPEKYPASELREYCYPALGQQFDALYKARLGDNTMQTKIDAHIKFVKDNIPMDDKEYTFEEMNEIKQGFVSEDAFIAEYVGLED